MAPFKEWVFGVLAFGTLACSAATTVSISSTASHAIPTTLFGQMFEDINHSGDGGIYAELLQNRAFQQVTPGTSDALTAWSALGGASIAVVSDPKPVSNSLPNSLQFTVPAGTTGSPGFSNSGYWGIKVDSTWTYTASLYYRFPTSSSTTSTLTVALVSSTGATLASASSTIHGTDTTWKQLQFTLKPASTASNVDNTFVVTVKPTSTSAATTINFALFSLFPPTFNNRPNGIRLDLAQTLIEMGPKFFRFPGGNNLGQTTATRWQWNATVGSLLNRPGRVGDWGYVNTDGLGIFEYLQFFEDAGMEPIMAVWSGYSLGGVSLAENQLAPYIQQAISQINFVIGDPSTTTEGALRASLGHPAPFTLHYVEVGNEDFFAGNTYPYRWRDFVGNLTQAFPQLTFIATSDAFDPVISPNPQAYDVHVYQTPSWFAQNSFYYDGFERNGTKYFEGEYAGISTNAGDLFGTPADGRLLWPTMQSSTGEAAFMTGLERNSDIVFAASYAPLLQHVNSTQWTPNLIAFTPGEVVRSTSFYVQKLFATNRGDQYLPSTLPSPTGTLFWSVSRLSTTQEVIIKVSNTISTSAPLVFQLPFTNVATSGTLQVLTGAETAANTPEAPNAVVPTTSTIATGKTLNFTAAPFSVSVIRVKAS